MKYHTSKSEDEILPNKLRLTDPKIIGEEEYKGFLRAEIRYEMQLNELEIFSWSFIAKVHKAALEHLYDFAGTLRQVNISKGGFLFPAAKFLPDIIKEFEKDFLLSLPKRYDSYENLITHIAPLHAEFLFIHPFREGNGRTARLLANLIALKHGFRRFSFNKITDKNMKAYIAAVQAASHKKYEPMIAFFRNLE
ncbi:Fic/DOC family protein [Sinomicrobium weinanense]|uniref:protein adenylyltransferase n=1 Tax=Sinomicrobium weinanense TaxID=2842200 RepID=A0A926JSC5_9FLAO|nr:Fic family protein [Sinomicrobium weinanense]MBC9796311.1 Fic family protein [Sinomicrobium weinanense]MBU3123208.1 Fic family protein [Sinomicrobium weinanense]